VIAANSAADGLFDAELAAEGKNHPTAAKMIKTRHWQFIHVTFRDGTLIDL
jgi:hypothetical protein